MSKNLIPLYSWHQTFTFGLLRFMSPDMQMTATICHLVMEDPTIHTLTDVNLKHFIGVIYSYKMKTDTVYM